MASPSDALPADVPPADADSGRTGPGGSGAAAAAGDAAVARLELLSAEDLGRTCDRLASQVLERVADSQQLVLLGIPTRGVDLARVLAARLAAICGHPIAHGSLDPTFHRDDLERIGTRLVEATQLPGSLDGRQVVLVDDVIFTGRTVRAALEALQAWGRPRRVLLLVMVDRGHRELPIQPDFCGRVVPTARQESIELCLQAIDGEEGIYLRRA
ncbi:MAG: bifunctional pyr operon transcriptional regulator/uracil phosphoribosyltransferase PyrR [Cyanobacteria bacterium]|nr:bifunctional pyr operon transcriptional regulator/uracil phosphoribosyltransferase PyrR [Cyanobacteriota bacterium]